MVRVSIAAQVVRQARAKAGVANLAGHGMLPAKLVQGNNAATGLTFLHAKFLGQSGPSTEVDLSFMLKFPRLAQPFGEGYRIWAVSVSDRTRHAAACELRRMFFCFLSEQCRQDVELASLDRALFVTYVGWLNRPHATRLGGPFAHGTRKGGLSHLRSVLAALTTIPRWAQDAARALSFVPENPWPGGCRKATPRVRLSRDHLADIIRAAEAEIRSIQTRFRERQDLIEIGRRELQSEHPNYRDLTVCLAALDSKFDGVMPGLSGLDAVDHRLALAVQCVHTLRTVTSYFYAGSRDLIPFVILVSVATAFNPETVLSLTWKDIVRANRLGLPTIQITGPKRRSAEDPTILLDASPGAGFGVVNIFDTLKTITARLRPCLADSRDQDRIFVFAQERGHIAPKAYRHRGGAAADASLRWSLRRFAMDNRLAQFSLDQLRPTILDEVHLFTGDLLAVRSIAAHKNPETVWKHYTSDGTKRRYQERLGEVTMLRERWLTTDGRIDPRNTYLGSRMDRGSATPGFLCFDPNDSPRVNQSPGKLCAAYGECPACPLAAAATEDPAAVALYLALQESIYRAQGRITPVAWLARWAPILCDLQDLIRHVSRRTLRAAKNYKVDLPTVG